MPLELHIPDDLGLQEAYRVARGGVTESRQEFVGDGSTSYRIGCFQNGDLEALPGEVIGAGQAVVTRTDDNRVVQMSPANFEN